MKEPQFNDLHVLQRAQRVVPLDTIRARRRNRTLWFLSGAFALAMMLGAASALVTVRIKQRRQLTQINTEIPAPETTAPETVAAAPVESAAEVPAATEEVAPPPVKHVVTPKKQIPMVAADRPRVVGSRSDEVQPSATEQLQQIREAVLYDQWQERRMRRVMRRERRNRGDRDLSHVDEIFEGTRRRDRP
jgi:hypothetical protein